MYVLPYNNHKGRKHPLRISQYTLHTKSKSLSKLIPTKHKSPSLRIVSSSLIYITHSNTTMILF